MSRVESKRLSRASHGCVRDLFFGWIFSPANAQTSTPERAVILQLRRIPLPHHNAALQDQVMVGQLEQPVDVDRQRRLAGILELAKAVPDVRLPSASTPCFRA
jgi:hypothetical protein